MCSPNQVFILYKYQKESVRGWMSISCFSLRRSLKSKFGRGLTIISSRSRNQTNPLREIAAPGYSTKTRSIFSVASHLMAGLTTFINLTFQHSSGLSSILMGRNRARGKTMAPYSIKVYNSE
jgi:hypothetical protein